MSVKKSALISYVLALFAALFVSASTAGCGDNYLDEGMMPDPGSSTKEITRFTVNGQDATITGNAIALQLPFGTDLTNLTPTIVHTGAALLPASGVPKDFTNPVLYTVTAEDGSTAQYTATITAAASSAKDITKFTLLGVDGTINGTSITLMMPFGTAVTSMIPTIVHTGVSINPPSGTAQNFSAPVTYTVTAADGSTKTYTVTVGVALSSSKDITQFTIMGINGTIAGTSISLTLPFGTSLASLTPTIMHTGASIAPASGAAQSFTAPVMYTVTAADGSTKTYTVTVGVALNSAKDITRFTILGVDGAISGTNISLQLPFGTSLASLTPTIVHTGASVSPASGVAHTFVGPQTYTVTAADGSTKAYTVNVTVALDSSKDITKFTILGIDGTINGTNISLTVPNGTSLASLTPTIMHTGASISPLSGVAQDFTGAVQYTVTAADGSTKVYTVNVGVAPSTSKDITSFVINGVSGTITGTTIALVLPFGTDRTSLSPAITHTGASIGPASGVAQDFTSSVQYTVTAMDGSTKTYTVTVSLALDDSKDITKFTILGIDGVISGTNISLVVPFGTSRASLTPTISITGVSVSPASGVAQDFTAPRQYTVMAMNGTTKTYTVTVTVALDNSKDITSFVINGIPGQINGTNITVWLPYGTPVTSLYPIVTHTGVSINPPNNTSQNFTTPVPYTVTAADGSTKTYTATVMIAPPSTKDITSFVINGVPGVITATTVVVTLPLNTPVTALTPTITHTGINIAPASGATVNFTMPVTYVVYAADGSSKQYTVYVVSPQLVSISVTPPGKSIAKGTTQQYTATGLYSDNTTQDLTAQVAWSTSPGSIASISTTGLAHGDNPGMTNVIAVLGSISGSTTLTVTAAALVSIAVTPADDSIAKGTNLPLTATGTYTDNTTQDLSSSVTWTTSPTGIVSISAAGLAHGDNVGTTTVTATLGAISGSTSLQVTAATLVSISVTPPTPSIAKGTSQSFTATGTYTDNSTQDITLLATWTSSLPGVASISTAGVAHGDALGTTTITATLDMVSGSTTLEVTDATLVSIEVAPATQSIAKGTDQQYAATGKYTDSSTQDLTQSVTWTASPGTVASISNAAGSKGVAHAEGAGQATITATLGFVSGTATLDVTAATVVSIAVTPVTQTIAKGTSIPFTATATYTDGTTQDLTTSVLWSTSLPLVASISNAAGSQGSAKGLDVGTTIITATLGALTDSTTLEVTAASLVSIDVTPNPQSIAKGTDQQYTATGNYTDGTTQDLTTSVTWSSSMGGVASISNAAGSKGLAHGEGQGTTTITATATGGIFGTATLNVTMATLVSIEVLPFNPSMPKGTAQNFTATGTYTDGSTQDLTTTVTWSTTNAAIAAVSNAAGTKGRVNAVDAGQATIRATGPLGLVFGESTVTVTVATLQSITIAPTDPSIALGTTQAFTATGVFSDSSTQDLTATVTWGSSLTGVATISNAAATKGVATSAGVGTTTISATFGAITGTTTLTVSTATLVRIDVTPTNQSLPRLITDDYTATGVYSDGTTQDLTASVTWSSSATNVATVSNANGTEGEVTTGNAGTTTITAFDPVSGLSGTTLLTVTNGVLLSITVTPNPATIAIGARIRFTATGNYSDGVSRNITNAVSWSSSAPSIAGAGNGRKKRGITIGKKAGMAVITATLNGISGSANLTVTNATLSSIEVLPAASTIPNKTKQFFTAVGHFSDGSTSDLTAAVSWSSTSTAVATISNQPFHEGQANAVGAGVTTIRALDSGTGKLGTTTLTVSSATLVSIAVTPANSMVIIGFPRQLTAIATYSDATTKNVTNEVTWSSMNGAFISVSNAIPTQGLATAIAPGSTTVTARYPLTSVVGSTGITAIN